MKRILQRIGLAAVVLMSSQAIAQQIDSCVYDNGISNILNNSCAVSGCHVSGFANGDFSSYTEAMIKVNDGTFEARALQQMNMPPSWGSIPALTADELADLQCWIDGGSAESAADTCNFDDDVQAIINASCATPGCHEASFSNGDFTTYAGVKAKVDDADKFETRVLTNQDMPPSWGSIPALTYEEKVILECWLAGGATENDGNGGATSTFDHSTKKHFTAFPNPFGDQLNFTFDAAVVSANIRSIEGQIIKTIKLNTQGRLTVDLSDLSSGMYFVEVRHNEGMSLQKIFKK